MVVVAPWELFEMHTSCWAKPYLVKIRIGVTAKKSIVVTLGEMTSKSRPVLNKVKDNNFREVGSDHSLTTE
jgi:hypothetical protein